MAQRYAAVLLEERVDAPFDLMGTSFGASSAHHVAVASQQLGGSASRLILIDPNPGAFLSFLCLSLNACSEVCVLVVRMHGVAFRL